MTAHDVFVFVGIHRTPELVRNLPEGVLDAERFPALRLTSHQSCPCDEKNSPVRPDPCVHRV
jgi:hypothetical protein